VAHWRECQERYCPRGLTPREISSQERVDISSLRGPNNQQVLLWQAALAVDADVADFDPCALLTLHPTPCPAPPPHPCTPAQIDPILAAIAGLPWLAGDPLSQDKVQMLKVKVLDTLEAGGEWAGSTRRSQDPRVNW
jgi:hypothetical protein